ncbi:SprT family zinc-dependent metalloprotease [Psychromonas sp. Urea-02u-13]|uniref:SprT family zinc-dependent metalloprotease n=1 Tax=Psychromonas sp. Urea-02u-13 TaxID=2058326 RepID=UPI000C33A5F5|nr:SprT family zinc-dependent metalloprotease [Psychromonas sp. Urea-02u-13]PKG40652.1 SprT family zinc-dependent metalloprotease [Psychromonas sp. Urea-02u-13]
MLTEEDKKALKLQGEHFFIEAECFFVRAFERPTYLFNQRGRAAGTAHLQRNLIKINPILFINNKEEFFQQVIPHEVAHLITFQLYGNVRPHGKEWQSVMVAVFQRPALTTHQLDINDVIGKQFHYRCACTTHTLTIRRHNKVLKGNHYKCKLCQSLLTFEAEN